jgi:hypothetical protein
LNNVFGACRGMIRVGECFGQDTSQRKLRTMSSIYNVMYRPPQVSNTCMGKETRRLLSRRRPKRERHQAEQFGKQHMPVAKVSTIVRSRIMTDRKTSIGVTSGSSSNDSRGFFLFNSNEPNRHAPGFRANIPQRTEALKVLGRTPCFAWL